MTPFVLWLVVYIINHVQINGKWKTYYIQSLGNRLLKIWKGYTGGLLVQIHKFRPFLRVIYSIPTVYITVLWWQLSSTPDTAVGAPPPHPHFLLASAGFCRWCVHEGMWDAGWGTVLFLLLSNVEPLWRQHPCVGCCRVAIISDGGARHGCLMLPDWVLLNYSNKVFTGLTHSPVSSIKSEGEWFVNGLHFMAQWVVKICDKVEVSEFK